MKGVIGVLGLLFVAAVIGGCGSDNASQAQLDAASKQAGDIARLEQKVKDLQRQIRAQGGTTTATSSTSSTGSSSGTGSDCGQGVRTLNGHTTCPFALNVAATYYQSGQQGTVDVYSPSTGQHYSMSCTAGHPHTCSGGNDAQVSIP
jgi:hypothetical protein